MKNIRVFIALNFATLLLLSVSAIAQNPSSASESNAQVSARQINGYEPTWWKDAVVYQIYPRSFKDSNGDGIGDLNGITKKLDYIQKLGVNVIWLSPHYDSPNADNGYDIRDYRKVMAEFGTMADFDRMLAAIKQRHMRLIVDLVVNHTSDEHRWFVESRKSKDNPYRDYYIWRPGKPNPSAPNGFDPPNNYPSYFEGSAWQFDPQTKEFYLHLFAVKQPDLNWDNPKVRDEVYGLMRFWLDKGVDGFRMDVIPLISKRPGLPDLTPEELKDPSTVFANGPRMHEYLQEMHRKALAPYDTMTVGEAIGTTLAQTPAIVDDRRHELNMIFNFDAVRTDMNGNMHQKPKLTDLKAIYTQHAKELDKHSWDTVFLSNHDNPRLVSSFGDDSPEFRVPSAKLLETMLLTLRGTPFLYQGDELGMTNYPFTKISEFDDIAIKNAYKTYVTSGKVPEAMFVGAVSKIARDNARTPMQWDATANGGFTTAEKAWLSVNPNYASINAAAELADPDSIYHFTQRMIALRHAHKALVYGDYLDLDPANPEVFAYTRTLGEERFLVVLNFASTSIAYNLPQGTLAGDLVLSNLSGVSPAEAHTAVLNLKPWEARVYRF
jgi:oligo-1,6-glucosidase